jgi:hypothetical protein
MKTKKDPDASHLHRAWFAPVWPASRTGKVLLAILVTVGTFFAVVFYTTGKEPMEFILELARWDSANNPVLVLDGRA